MEGRRFEPTPGSLGALRHPCDLDLLLFFQRHPRAILTSDRLAAYIGYDLNQLARSLDVLVAAGLLERSQSRAHSAQLHLLKTPLIDWAVSVLDMASTPDGRATVIAAIKEFEAHEKTEYTIEDETATFACVPTLTAPSAGS